MAKIVYGGGVAAASGKLAGQVFSRNKGGSYLRQFVKPTNPRTVLQLDARDRLTQFSNEFRQLTQDQQTAFLTYANEHPIVDRLGNVIKLTAMQAYVKINTNRDLAADPASNSAVPIDPAFGFNIVDTALPLVLAVGANTADIPLGAGANAGQILQVYCSPPVSAGINNTAAVERFLVSHLLTAGEILAVKFSIHAEIIARFGAGAFLATKKVVTNCYEYQLGQLGAASRNSGVIAA